MLTTILKAISHTRTTTKRTQTTNAATTNATTTRTAAAASAVTTSMTTKAWFVVLGVVSIVILIHDVSMMGMPSLSSSSSSPLIFVQTLSRSPRPESFTTDLTAPGLGPYDRPQQQKQQQQQQQQRPMLGWPSDGIPESHYMDLVRVFRPSMDKTWCKRPSEDNAAGDDAFVRTSAVAAGSEKQDDVDADDVNKNNDSNNDNDPQSASLVYVKTHKAASTTLAGVTLHLARRHNCTSIQNHHPTRYPHRDKTKSFIFSSIRDPVSRALSWFQFIVSMQYDHIFGNNDNYSAAAATAGRPSKFHEVIYRMFGIDPTTNQTTPYTITKYKRQLGGAHGYKIKNENGYQVGYLTTQPNHPTPLLYYPDHHMYDTGHRTDQYDDNSVHGDSDTMQRREDGNSSRRNSNNMTSAVGGSVATLEIIRSRVRRIIEDYDWIILVERMDESLVVLAMLLNGDGTVDVVGPGRQDKVNENDDSHRENRHQSSSSSSTHTAASLNPRISLTDLLYIDQAKQQGQYSMSVRRNNRRNRGRVDRGGSPKSQNHDNNNNNNNRHIECHLMRSLGTRNTIYKDHPALVKYFSSNEHWLKYNYGDYLLYVAMNKSLDMTIDVVLGRDNVDEAVRQYRALKQKAQRICQSETIFPCSTTPAASSSTTSATRNDGIYQPASVDHCYQDDWGCGYPCLNKHFP
jgi:Sulfotransferase family